MIVMSFDLSTVCIGIVIAKINDNSGEIEIMRSCPVVPSDSRVPESLGFMATKKKLPTSPKAKTEINTYFKKDEQYVSKSEKQKRDREVRKLTNKFHLENLAQRMDAMISSIEPNLINTEINAMFNGVLTIELLAKLSGQLLGIAASNSVKVNEYSVATVRKAHNVARLVSEYAKTLAKEDLLKVKDLTKAALRDKMQKKYCKYGLLLHTDDEGDACVVFDYWYENVYKKERAAKRNG